MKEKIDDIEQILKSELDKEAQSIQADLENNSPSADLSDEAKERMKANIDKSIEQYNKEAVYSKLSEEDREALELGKRIRAAQQKEAQRKETDCEFAEEIGVTPVIKTVSRKKINRKAYVGLAAVLVMTMAVGVNSFGGPDKIVEVIKTQIGGREVVKVNTGENIAKSAEENEKKAYQAIKEKFGITPVRMTIYPENMKFESVQIDEALQTIELFYVYNDEAIIYCISLDYSEASWGMGVEDAEAVSWIENVKNCEIEIKEYSTPKTAQNRYFAQFIYNNIGYSINGTMDKEDFITIVKNLHFL